MCLTGMLSSRAAMARSERGRGCRTSWSWWPGEAHRSIRPGRGRRRAARDHLGALVNVSLHARRLDSARRVWTYDQPFRPDPYYDSSLVSWRRAKVWERDLASPCSPFSRRWRSSHSVESSGLLFSSSSTAISTEGMDVYPRYSDSHHLRLASRRSLNPSSSNI